MQLYVGSVQYVVSLSLDYFCYFIITRLMLFLTFLFSYLVRLFSILCILCFFIVFLLFLLLYIAVSFLFFYKFTDHCQRVESELQ